MRAAANKPFYTFVMWNDNNDRPIKSVRIELPSSSTIVKQTLAAPGLVRWASSATRDMISGLVSTLVDTMQQQSDEIIDLLTDADMLQEYMDENKLTPDDMKESAAERGRERHDVLERIAKASLQDVEAGDRLARKALESDDGWTRAIGYWWTDNQVVALSSEEVLPCPEYGFCGTSDIVWYNEASKTTTLTDLKTRGKDDGEAYDSDFFQLDSYRLAWSLLHPDVPIDRTSIVVARPDGTYIEEENRLEEGAFLDLMEVWKLRRSIASRKNAIRVKGGEKSNE